MAGRRDLSPPLERFRSHSLGRVLVGRNTQKNNSICAVYPLPKIFTQLQTCTQQRPPLHDVTFDPQQVLRLVGQKADIEMLDAVWSMTN